MTENAVYKALTSIAAWEEKAPRCIYRMKGGPADICDLLKSKCMHKKRIVTNCSAANCPLDRSNDEESNEQMKSIW